MKASLKSNANRGQTVGTRWGPVVFDADGHATMDVESEDELQMLRHLGWLVEAEGEAPSMSTADIESASLSEDSDHHEHYASPGADTKSLHPVRPKKR